MPLTPTVALGCDRHPDCDRCILHLLHAHLIQPEGDDSICDLVQIQLGQFKQTLSQGGIIRLASDGQVKFITPQAVQQLSQYFGSQDFSVLPDVLQQWCNDQLSPLKSDSHAWHPRLPFCVQHKERRLLIYFIPEPIGKHYLLLLEEQALSSFSVAALESLGLTQREAEVLFWVTRDKSNAAIAKVLDCCEGTVRKHLEQKC